jgi:hypothetical protein
LLLAAGGFLVFSRTTASPQLSTLKITVLSSSAHRMHVPLLFDNQGGGAIVIWEPGRIERKETGRVTVGGTRVQALAVAGTNVSKAPHVQIIAVELTGTNYGPWRVLLPVTRYDLIARLETLFGKRVGTLMSNSRALESLLRHSSKWVASDWFDEPIGRAMGPWRRDIDLGHGMASDFESHQEDSQTFLFVIHHFHTRYRRWPTNFAEVKLFAATKAYLQPEIPARYNESWFENAVFTTNSNGGLSIKFQNGSMSIGPM